jgi:hypothetical protein
MSIGMSSEVKVLCYILCGPTEGMTYQFIKVTPVDLAAILGIGEGKITRDAVGEWLRLTPATNHIKSIIDFEAGIWYKGELVDIPFEKEESNYFAVITKAKELHKKPVMKLSIERKTQFTEEKMWEYNVWYGDVTFMPDPGEMLCFTFYERERKNYGIVPDVKSWAAFLRKENGELLYRLEEMGTFPGMSEVFAKFEGMMEVAAQLLVKESE